MPHSCYSLAIALLSIIIHVLLATAVSDLIVRVIFAFLPVHGITKTGFFAELERISLYLHFQSVYHISVLNTNFIVPCRLHLSCLEPFPAFCASNGAVGSDGSKIMKAYLYPWRMYND